MDYPEFCLLIKELFFNQYRSRVCQTFNNNERRTTAYHPQTNGLCERFNQALQTLLRARMNKDQDNWYEELPNVLLSYRISKQETLGISPFELLYGRQARPSTVNHNALKYYNMDLKVEERVEAEGKLDQD